MIRCAVILVALTTMAGAARAQSDEEWDDPKPAAVRWAEGWKSHVLDEERARWRRHGPGGAFADEEVVRRKGSLRTEEIKGVVSAHKGEVWFCYMRERKTNPELEGQVVVRFTVSTEGAVTRSEVDSSTVDNATVESCIAGAVRRWTFPRPTGDGSVTVTWPFKLVATQ